MPLAAIRSRVAPLTPAAGHAEDGPSGPEHCVTCGQPAGTPFCPHCGERRAGDRPLHVRELFEELWDSFVSVDGRVVRSFWTLVRHPGALTAAYVRGERRRYLTPLAIFFSVNAVFFVVATAHGFNGFTAPLASHLNVFGHQAIARRLVYARLAERHVSLTTYASAFDAVAASQGKTLLLALVPMFAACTAVVQLPRRRPTLQHITFGLHAVSVALLAAMAAFYALVYGSRYVVTAVLWLRAWLTRTHARPRMLDVSDGQFTVIIGALFLAWLTPALRRTYGGGWAASAVRALILAFSLGPALWAYRALLFFTAFWAT